VAGVDQHEGAAERRAAGEIGAKERLPLLDHGLRGLGEAVAGEIDQVVGGAEGEEVDLLGAAGGVRGAGEGLAADEGVDQARLADVGAAGEADLDPVGGRKAVNGDDALEELAGAGEEEAAALERFGVGLGGEGEGAPQSGVAGSPTATRPPSVTSA
jgi:hypothetical protein